MPLITGRSTADRLELIVVPEHFEMLVEYILTITQEFS